MRRRVFSPLAFGLFAALTLAGCGGSSGNLLGFEKSSPDEFAVVKRAPLTLPPDFGLRPPRPGAARPQAVSARSEAKNSLIKTAPKPQTRRNARAARAARIGKRSVAEVALLKRTGAIDVDPEIRQVINREAAGAVGEDDKDFIDTLLFWRDDEKKESAQDDLIVDPKGESRRLRENQVLGKPMTAGVTPSIRRKKAGFLF